MEATRADHLLRTTASTQDSREREAQQVALADFLDRPRPVTWRLR